MITAENVQWKKAILLVMAVEEAAELIAVDRVVGCVEVQHDLLRWHGVGLKEQLDEEPFDSSCAADDLLVPAILVGPDGGQFEPIEGALAGQGLALVAFPEPVLAGGIFLSHDGCQQGIVPQVIVVVEVFVAQGQGIDSLGYEMFKGVLDELGVTMIGKASGELPNDTGEFLGLAEQQAAAVGRDVAAIKRGEDLAGAEEREIQITRVGRGKIDQPLLRMLSLTVRVSAPLSGCLAVTLCSTLCHHRVAFRIECKCLYIIHL